MGLLGTIALYGALVSILGTIGVGVAAARSGSASLARLTGRGAYAIAFFVTMAVLALQVALITLDFSLKYVGEYTSTTLSVLYRIGSMWAGQGGSLLLWAFIIAGTGAWTVRADRRKDLGLSPWAHVVSALFAGLFVVMVTFFQNPFAAQTEAVADGMGLNPLLQDPLQVIHPVFLYGGYVLYTVPFAVVLGELIAGKVSGPWLDYARVWAIISWISLSIGMVLGARWAYAELGWGGYWAWDPVENASLIPWLSGTALLHTGLSHRGNRDRIRMTSIILLAATFNLCLFGTFLTRSGVIQSVHAFGESNLGPFLGGAIVVSVLVCGAVLVWRLPSIKYDDPKRHSWGWLGQVVLVVLLVAMTIATLWGTLYPLFARAFLNQEIAVSAGFFKAVVTPMGVGLLVLLAISPFLASQRAANVQREAAIRAVMFIVVMGGAYILGSTIVVSGVLALSVLSVKTILWKAQPKIGAALKSETERTRAVAHAGSPYLAHMGLVIMLAAIAINVTGEVKQQVKLEVGKTATVSGQHIRLDDARLMNYPDRQALEGFISLLDDKGNATGNLVVKTEAFANSDQPHTQVGIKSGILRDVYVVIDGWPDDISNDVAWLRLSVYDNPAINWIWFGGSLLGLAGILYAMPARRRRPLAAAAAADPELERIIDTAMLAVRSGIDTTSNERVNSLIRTARDLNGGDDATDDQIVAFLERARGNVAPASAPVSVSRNTLIGAGLGVAIVVGLGAYVAGHMNSGAVPGISGDVTTSGASASASTDPLAASQTEIDALMKRIKADAKDVEAYSQLGAIYYTAGSDIASAGDSSGAVKYFGQAAEFFKKRSELAPKEVNSWLDLGASYLASQQMDLSFKALTKAAEVDPNSQMAHFDLGIWYLNATPAQPKKATAEFQKVVDIDPTSDIGKTAAQHVGVASK